MKGLLLSLLLFLLYIISSVILSHLLKPQRHSKLFIPLTAIAIICFLFAYHFSSVSLGFLPTTWQATYPWLDIALGIVILLFNIHSYIDWFFGFNGGFSTSLMMLLLKNKGAGATYQDLLANYRTPTGDDKIHGWRLPRLEETGYLHIDSNSDCLLTKKGKLVARIASVAKKIFSLGLGG